MMAFAAAYLIVWLTMTLYILLLSMRQRHILGTFDSQDLN